MMEDKDIELIFKEAAKKRYRTNCYSYVGKTGFEDDSIYSSQ